MMSVPNDFLNYLPEGAGALVSDVGEVFAIFISMLMTVVNVIFALDIPDVKSCPKCPFMRGSGLKNHTMDFYKCETQRDFLESMWNPYISSYWSIMSAMLAGCSMIVGQIASPPMRLVKHTFIAAIASLMWYIKEFQYHFESVSTIWAYVKSVLTVYMSILPLVVVIRFRPTGTPRKLVKISIVCMGTALMFHLGLSAYNLFCGRITRPLSAFLAAYFFVVSKLAMLEEVPSHVSLVMCLLVVPPTCPMVILLLCWCFDGFWTDLSKLVVAPRQPTVPQPIQEGVSMADTNRPRLRFINGYRLPPTFPLRSFR